MTEFQALRQKIDDEYRVVVERMVLTVTVTMHAKQMIKVKDHNSILGIMFRGLQNPEPISVSVTTSLSLSGFSKS